MSMPDPSNPGIMPGPAYDAVVKAARDETIEAEAVDNLTEQISQLQAQINQLTATAQAQANQIARLTAAMTCHTCPNEPQISDLMIKESDVHPTSVAECVQAGLCNCELGYILTAATWSPPQIT